MYMIQHIVYIGFVHIFIIIPFCLLGPHHCQLSLINKVLVCFNFWSALTTKCVP